MARVWPLTGRDEELRWVEATLGPAGDARGVVLAGAAGVGKTRLARETLTSARDRGVRVRSVVATETARAMPLGAFSGILGAGGIDPTRLVPHAMASLMEGAGPAGVLVAVDDAHLLDDVSALLLHHVVHASAAKTLITVRTGEETPDAVSGLWDEGLLERIELQPLSMAETMTLLSSVLDGAVDTSAGERIWAMTRGNPLYLRQLVEGELQAGRLDTTRGVWRWTGEVQVASGLVDQVSARMGQLSGAVAEVLDVLALAEPLGLAQLRSLVTNPSAIEEAEERGLIAIERDGRRVSARLGHPLYGEARRALIGRLRARRLRGEIVSALQRIGMQRADDAMRVAVLAVDSDLELDAATYFSGAGRAAQLIDMPLAIRLGHAAVEAGGGFAAQRLVATATAGLGLDADGEYAILEDLARSDAEIAQACAARVVHLAWIAARPAEAEAVAAAAADRLEGDALVPITAVRAYLSACLSRPRIAAELAADALAGHPSDESIAFAACGHVLALGTMGHVGRTRDVARAGYEAAARSTEAAFVRVPLAVVDTLGLRLAGHVHEALAAAEACVADVKGLPAAEPYAAYILGEGELACGRVRSAIKVLEEVSAALSGPASAGGYKYMCLLALVRGYAAAGDAPAARAAYTDTLRYEHPTMQALAPERWLALAWVSAADGVLSEAIAHAHTAASLAAEVEQFAHEVLALEFAARLGDGTVAERLSQLAAQVDGPRAGTAARHAAAVAADDPAGLETASVEFERMGDLLAAADAAAQSSVSHTRKSHKAAALAASARAQHLADRCEGARTPALIAGALPLPVTAREREILMMAAAGLTNQQIADRLVVSVRTVEGHLYRAGAKIGTTDRARFAALLDGAAPGQQT